MEMTRWLFYTVSMDTDYSTQQTEDYRRIEQAIRYLQANYRRHPSLDEIAQSVHLSKYHFQRLFKRWAGVTPGQFQAYLTLEHAKEQLRQSSSVLDAALEAGLSGPGRLHDLFVTVDGVTPGEYKHLGEGLEIRYGFHESPFGTCLLAVTARGICTLQFIEQGGEGTAVQKLADAWPGARLKEDNQHTAGFISQIFTASPPETTRPFHLLLKGTNFQLQVWQALLSIPSGSLVSYEQIARYLGRPRATRAVAAALARNPVAYLIPCHRVIGKNGELTGYRWGTTRKQAILVWEAVQAAA